MKQLVVLLEVPYTKLRRKIPLIAIYLKYERNLYGYFANRLYYSRFNVPIDSQLLTHEAYMQYQRTGDIDGIVHPLGECLDNLYGDILGPELRSPDIMSCVCVLTTQTERKRRFPLYTLVFFHGIPRDSTGGLALSPFTNPRFYASFFFKRVIITIVHPL